ncbi:hypothetical protein [Aeromicrobium ginsengisoli]|uniref:DUF4259 domain-containing protein n=1 Tax=Aeromicrobium ginsengisoli TaxID=363867 RepID=A0A5M4FHY2_9ACTN|nr:hypothetical protein [Aeromicrobium ginsengisoli]KAA1399578.1 hypothetical protein ESP70_002090 [Aeromicrobium ginsengisoli]
MGAWGTAIFSDDTAADIRSEYRELLEDKVPDQEATRRVLSAYEHLDDDEEHLLWLALAAAQSQVGRLDDEVKAKALDVIESGRGLQLWAEAGAPELAKRKAALQKLQAALTGPQPSPKTLKRPWRHITNLGPGDVLAQTASNGQLALFRVVRVDDHRVGVAPIIERLDWTGSSPPNAWRLRRLKVAKLEQTSSPSPERPAVYRVAVHRKKDPDWQQCGFVLVANLPARAGDEHVQAWQYCSWGQLQREVERRFTT